MGVVNLNPASSNQEVRRTLRKNWELIPSIEEIESYTYSDTPLQIHLLRFLRIAAACDLYNVYPQKIVDYIESLNISDAACLRATALLNGWNGIFSLVSSLYPADICDVYGHVYSPQPQTVYSYMSVSQKYDYISISYPEENIQDSSSDSEEEIEEPILAYCNPDSLYDAYSLLYE